jgi:hypothetical protein
VTGLRRWSPPWIGSLISGRLLPILLGFTLACCSAAASQPTEVPVAVNRPVQIREYDRPLISTPGSEYTVTIEGRVTDADTGMMIPDATILVVTVAGSYEFWGGLFEISFPTETVVNIKARSPGCRVESRQLKDHYKCNARQDIDSTQATMHRLLGQTITHHTHQQLCAVVPLLDRQAEG